MSRCKGTLSSTVVRIHYLRSSEIRTNLNVLPHLLFNNFLLRLQLEAFGLPFSPSIHHHQSSHHQLPEHPRSSFSMHKYHYNVTLLVLTWCWMSARTLSLSSKPASSPSFSKTKPLTDRRKSPALWRLLEYHDHQQEAILTHTNTQKLSPSPRPPEVMAPAGGWPQLKAAVANGADAVYVGLAAFSARARAANFNATELVKAVHYCHNHGVHLYVALNTLIFDNEWPEVASWVDVCRQAGVDALIVQDLGLCRLLQSKELAGDLPIHSSTQQSITNADGVEFAAYHHGATRVVLGRELSVNEIRHVHQRISNPENNNRNVEIEVFCHGALCVSYSGQCFSSEAWGGRSANRGQCAQACRLPYGLVVNGEWRPNSEKNKIDQKMQYILSPQDLSGLDYVPQLIQAGVACLKIEGRLKDETYVAATTRAYRQAVDRAWQQLYPNATDIATTASNKQPLPVVPISRPELVQLFARGQDETHDGLTPGFLAGTRHQALVRGRSPRHRGVHVGKVVQYPMEASSTAKALWVQLDDGKSVQLKLGDGLVVDRGRPQEHELGGTIYDLQEFDFENGRMIRIDLGREAMRTWQEHEQRGDVLAPPGAHVWRTHDADVTKKFRKLATTVPFVPKPGVHLRIQGEEGQPFQIVMSDDRNRQVIVTSEEPVQKAQGKGLSSEQIRKAIGTLGNTDISLAGDVQVTGMEGLWCPVSQIKKARRQAVVEWEALYGATNESPTRISQDLKKVESSRVKSIDAVLKEILPRSSPQDKNKTPSTPRLSVLCRTFEQVDAACDLIKSTETTLIAEIMVDFLELEGMKEAMERIRQTSVRAVVASPRILKPEEGGIWKSLLALRPDALLVRSTGLLYRMQKLGGQGARINVGTVQQEDWVKVPELLGDFSLNVANALTATELLNAGLSRVTASYDLNARSIRHMADLLQDSAQKLEVVAHCKMPVFHTEHCVFARFLSKGNSYLDCGHVCTRNSVHLRDELTGLDNVVLADMGCRNTVFAAQAQSGVHSLKEWNSAGIQHFRIELVDEDKENVEAVIQTYMNVVEGQLKPSQAWESLEYIRDSNGRAAGVSLGSFRNTQERRAGEVEVR